MAESAMSHPKRGSINFNQFLNGILAMPNMAIRMPDVGIMVLAKPSPQVKAKMAVLRVMPNRSAKGAISGMVVAACPDPDGIKKLRMVWNTNMPSAANTLGKYCKVLEA